MIVNLGVAIKKYAVTQVNDFQKVHFGHNFFKKVDRFFLHSIAVM